MQRRIIRKLKIGEISAVDRPAQTHARAVIMKRADERKEIKMDTGTAALSLLHAKAAELRKREPNLTIEQCFTKVYCDPENADLAKLERAGNRPRTDVSVKQPENASTGAAYLALDVKAEQLRKSMPHLTREQCFAKIYEDPSNAELARLIRPADTHF